MAILHTTPSFGYVGPQLKNSWHLDHNPQQPVAGPQHRNHNSRSDRNKQNNPHPFVSKKG